MNLTFERCREILDTLPIGYYLGRRVPISLSDNERTSFYSPIEDTITISFPIIAQGAKMLPNNMDDEKPVRSMLYHEVSHAFITPKDLNPYPIYNIFEDERIETVLRHYYKGVNFREQLYNIHGGTAPKATNADRAFFNAVRFGLGPAEIQTMITDCIKDFSDLTRGTGYPRLSHYTGRISDIYRKVAKMFATCPDMFNMPLDGESEGEFSCDLKERTIPGAPDTPGQNENSNAGETMETMENGFLAQAANPTTYASNAKQKKMLNDFQKNAETIISNFNKKNSGGSGFNSYSGVFNPRATIRKDYRYFDRKASAHGNNTFGTCHLNLIIDCSGSYQDNESITNGILAALSAIERKNKNFSLDVAFINENFRICGNVAEREMSAGGGNRIPSDMKEILIKMQKPNTCNYNIVLFDGDALSNQWDVNFAEKIRRFGAFDMKQTTLITDPENEMYFKNGFTAAKVVVTNKYVNELIKNIERALTIGFN